MIEAVSGGVLNGQELTRISVVFDIAIGAHQPFVTGHKSAPPSCHVKTFARRMEFDSDFLCSGCSEKAQWLTFKYQRRISSVVNHDQMMLLSKPDDPCKELLRSACTGRVVRIIHHQHLRFV